LRDRRKRDRGSSSPVGASEPEIETAGVNQQSLSECSGVRDGEDGLVRLEIDQATRARKCRVIGRRLEQRQPEKLAQCKRIRGTPRNRPLGVQAFEMADPQQAEVAARRQARSVLVRIEPLAQSLDESVEVVLVENPIQSRVERMGGTARQVLGATHIDTGLA
jgi:ssDNA-binding replication factor A large subunit